MKTTTFALAFLLLCAALAPAVENVLDKRLNLETATRLGIPCPAEVRPESAAPVPA